MRFFLVSMIAFVIVRIGGRRLKQRPGLAGISSTVLVAVLFGISHLPVMKVLTELDAAIIARVILLNSIGGIVFGYLFVKRGLVYAMISHFSADLVLQVFFPLIYF